MHAPQSGGRKSCAFWIRPSLSENVTITTATNCVRTCLHVCGPVCVCVYALLRLLSCAHACMCCCAFVRACVCVRACMRIRGATSTA